MDLYQDPILAAIEAHTRPPPKPEKTVWLLGAGFSKFLGAPLFSECFSDAADSWVNGWLVANKCERDSLKDAKRFWDGGISKSLWKNAEQCIGAVNDALEQPVLRARIQTAISNEQDHLGPVCAQLSQYMAIATSAFMDRMEGGSDTPEQWLPFLEWMRCLTAEDAVISFNYDRVVEVLRAREKKEDVVQLVKLHGTSPPRDELEALVKQRKPVTTIKVPGPAKAADTNAQEWKDAATLLKQATHLVIMGYSFPESDPYGRQFILRHCETPRVTVVLGRDQCTDGDRVARMFKRVEISDSTNTELYVQEYLSEGTAKVDDKGRFNHRRIQREAKSFAG